MAYLNKFFDKYQIFSYILYEYIYKFVFANYNNINLLFFIILLILGFLTVLTPCFISIVPILLTYIYSDDSYDFNRYLFVSGVITSVLAILFLGNFINLYPIYNRLPIVSSILLMLISLNLMQIINLTNVTNLFYSKLTIMNNDNTNIKSYVVGLITGISSIPCNTSIILFIVFLLKRLGSLSFLYMFIYILGCLIPLIFITKIKIDYKRSNKLLKIWEAIFPISGSFLLFLASLILMRSLFL